MYIEKIKCNNCNSEGRPGDPFTLQGNFVIECACGNLMEPDDIMQQMILSKNFFVRQNALSDYHQHGSFEIIPGTTLKIEYEEKLELISKVSLTPTGSVLHVQAELLGEYMLVTCGVAIGSNAHSNPVTVNFSIYGIKKLEDVPFWRQQFINASKELANHRYKNAFFYYSIAFETFLEEFLNFKICEKYDDTVAAELNQRSSVEVKITRLLKLISGKTLKDRKDVYSNWHVNVQKIRNQLFHGKNIEITSDMAEAAHQAVYDAIIYIQNEF